MKRYTIVGGCPFNRNFTALKICGHYDTKAEVLSTFDQHYSDCGGLILVVDNKTGQQFIPGKENDSSRGQDSESQESSP